MVSDPIFTNKVLEFSFSLAQGNFSGGGNKADVTGKWARAEIEIVGDDSSGTLEALIFGLPESVMNQLTSMGSQFAEYGQNTVQVMAGDDANGVSLVFQGHIFACYMDGSAQPYVPLRVFATSDGLQRVQPAPSTSQPGGQQVSALMSNLAGQMGVSFENNGVSAVITNPYFSGSPRIQAAHIADAADIFHVMDRGVLAIWPKDGSRAGGPHIISPQTGMEGYPRFDSAQVIATTYFDPAILFGQQMTIQSDITAACGTWNINHIHASLSTEPKGPWLEYLTGYKP